MKQVLVIGGTGYLGQAVVREALKGGYQPIIFARSKPPRIDGIEITYVQGDIRRRPDLERAFSQLSPGARVIHSAGLITIERKEVPGLRETNVDGTQLILDLCRQFPVGRLVYVSSVHALPSTPGRVKQEIDRFSPAQVTGQYAKSKALATQLVLNRARGGLDAVVVYPSGIVGPGSLGQGQTTPLIRAFLAGWLPFYLSGGHDFVDVRDVAQGVMAALEKGQSGEGYILSGDYHTFREVIDMVAEVAGQKSPSGYLPSAILSPIAWLVETGAELLGKKPLLTSYMIEVLESFELYSHIKASRELGYPPRPMIESIRDTVDSLTEAMD